MVTVIDVAFVGYPVTDVSRARAFYEGLLGLKVDREYPIDEKQVWIEYDIGGATLAISNAWPPSGQSGPTIALEVANLDEALETFRAKRVPVTYGPMSSPVCRFFGIKDPDGNDITIHQRNRLP